MKKTRLMVIVMMTVALVLTGCTQSPDGQDAKPYPIEKVDGDIGGMKEPKDAEEVELVEHVDGDTSKFKINGKVETVRLIDTPETKHPKLGEQPLGKEASEFVKFMLENAREIKLESTWRREINTIGCWCMYGWTGKTYRNRY